jgi:hypothetical protein
MAEAGEDVMAVSDQLLDDLATQTDKASTPTMMTKAPAYRVIKDMGDAALPDLLRALAADKAVHPVMLLLNDITGQSPVAPAAAGHVDRMIGSWLAWGRAEKLI